MASPFKTQAARLPLARRTVEGGSARLSGRDDAVPLGADHRLQPGHRLGAGPRSPGRLAFAGVCHRHLSLPGEGAGKTRATPANLGTPSVEGTKGISTPSPREPPLPPTKSKRPSPSPARLTWPGRLRGRALYLRPDDEWFLSILGQFGFFFSAPALKPFGDSPLQGWFRTQVMG